MRNESDIKLYCGYKLNELHIKQIFKDKKEYPNAKYLLDDGCDEDRLRDDMINYMNNEIKKKNYEYSIEIIFMPDTRHNEGDFWIIGVEIENFTVHFLEELDSRRITMEQGYMTSCLMKMLSDFELQKVCDNKPKIYVISDAW